MKKYKKRVLVRCCLKKIGDRSIVGHKKILKAFRHVQSLLSDNYINLKQHKYLYANAGDKDRYLYLLPKVHKPVGKWPSPKMPAGRPILGDCATESRRVSDYVDHFLKPLANKHASYVKDTYDFVRKIRGMVIDNGLVTGDETGLYTNMNIQHFLACVRKAFRQNPNGARPDKEVLELLKIALENNEFEFNGTNYLQIFGTAMGKSFFQNLANIFLLEFDHQALHNFHIKPVIFLRYLSFLSGLAP